MRRSLALLSCLTLVACSAEVARPPSNVIWAEFDPSTNKIPTPNDLVRDAAGKHLALPITADLPQAEQEFRAYLNGLDGFPTSTPATLHFTGDVKARSISNDTLVVWKLDPQGAAPRSLEVQATYADTDHGLTLYPHGGWEPGARLVIAVRGGKNGVQGSKGELVTAAPAFTFLRAGKDLREHPWAIPGKTPAERNASALKLEAVRQDLEPLFQQLVDKGWSRDEIALVFSFTTSSHPAVRFDPLSQAVPLPNDLLIEPKTGLVSIPSDSADSEAQAAIKASLNTLDGFSTTGPFAAEATQPIDRATFTSASVRLFELASPPVEILGVERFLYADGTHFFAPLQSRNAKDPSPDVPFTVLKPKTTYFWIVTGLKGTSGQPVEAQPVGALLRLKGSLLEQGKSQVSGIADADAARLEPLRAKLAPALDALEQQGLPRSALAAVVPFTTLDVEGHTRALLKVPYEQNLPVTAVDSQVFSPTLNVFGSVAKVVEGHFMTYDRLDPISQKFGAAGQPRPIAFTLTYPKGFGPPNGGTKPKVILFGHGLTTERRLAWFEANRLAQEGFAVFSFDLPYHGERSSCHSTLPICSVINGLFATQNSDGSVTPGATICTDPGNHDQAGVEPAFLCSSGVCGDDGKCVGTGADFNRYGIYNLAYLNTVTDPGTPIASGAAFINLTDLGASRDHFRQAEIDFAAAYRFLTQADWTQILPDGLDLEKTDIGYTGISLGGILGGVESGSQPAITTLALNVGGAGFSDLFQESGIFGTILPPGLASQGIQIDKDYAKINLPAWQFLAASHWVLDDVDPVNIARYALQQRDDYVDVMTGETHHWPQKHVLLQMAGADTIVPNQSTYRLRAVLDPSCVVCDAGDEACARSQQCVFTTFAGDSHIFEVDPLENLNPAQLGAQRAGQEQVARFLSRYR
jgi:hypothetical protein